MEDDIIKIAMNGSPKKFGFRTQKDFINLLKPYNTKHVGIWDCNVFVTNDLSSTSQKMKWAKEWESSMNILIVTYEELIKEVFNVELRRDKIMKIKEKLKKV